MLHLFRATLWCIVAALSLHGEELLHEAFIVQEPSQLILEAIAEEPPAPLEESPLEEEGMLGIPGYWCWHHALLKFVWIGGIQRKSPPGMQWINGEWKQYDEGWVWFSGFWSPVNAGKLESLTLFPPAALEETLSPPPSLDYFWIHGDWYWEPTLGKYQWREGRWEHFDFRWVYVPAHYLWRGKEGIFFLPAYWDWPLDQRLTSFTTSDLEYYYPNWPDYHYCFQHHFHFHKELWASWEVVPSWWEWPMWWGLTSKEEWWLWWWWTHPGYPAPTWLTPALAAEIAPPSAFILQLMKEISPKPFITAKGVVSTPMLREAIQKVIGGKEPLLPADPRELEDVKNSASSFKTTFQIVPPVKGRVSSPSKPL